MKILILDSGTLINLSLNGLLYIIPELKKVSDVRFAITDEVKYEVVDRPSHVPRFELGALRIKQMLALKDLELYSEFGISKDAITKRRDDLMHFANSLIQGRGKFITIVSEAEISCLALSQELTKKRIENIIAIDERTTRLLAEKPQNLQKIMSERLHFNVSMNTTNFDLFKDFKFIRSTELVYVAYKKGVLALKDPKALEAVLYATKYKGSSVSFDEINMLKKL